MNETLVRFFLNFYLKTLQVDHSVKEDIAWSLPGIAQLF